jgi:hypothetical protein
MDYSYGSSNSDAANVMKAGNGSVVVACNTNFLMCRLQGDMFASKSTPGSALFTRYKIEHIGTYCKNIA